MTATDPKQCQHAGCPKSFERDPALEVACPECDAEPGTLCRRPSGHVVWNTEWDLPRGIHPERDVEALRQGIYGECPLGRCPESVADRPLENPSSSGSQPAGEQASLDDW